MNVHVVNRRILAFLVDMLLWGIVFVVFLYLFGTSGTYHTISSTTNQAGNVVGSGTNTTFVFYLDGMPAVVYYASLFLYFVLLEWATGATLGKVVLGLRVTNVDGSGITLGQSLVRNVLRIVDAFPYIIPNLVGLIALAGDSQKRRIGDRAARSLVVRKQDFSLVHSLSL